MSEGDSHESDILFCPFCGDVDALEVQHLEGTILYPAYRVACDNCGAAFAIRSDIDEWNAANALPAAQPDLTDPIVVHANMLRGTIAKPSLDQIIHLYGVDALCRALVPAICREAALDEMARLGQEFDAALKGESND